MSTLVVVAYGGGVNSSAMLVEAVNRGEKIDRVLFSDTGGERPATYAYVAIMSAWLEAQGRRPITTVRYETGEGKIETLEDRCLSQRMLPSLAYGNKRCSQRFKYDPQHKWIKKWAPAVCARANGSRVLKWIGFDADEPERYERAVQVRSQREARYEEDRCRGDSRAKLDVEWYEYRYPLIEWDMGRDECIDVIREAGLPIPPKSACFFCPSTSVREIVQLWDEAPELVERALTIEDQAEILTPGRGLGGNGVIWRTIIEGYVKQGKLFVPRYTTTIACECYDG